MTWPTYRLGEIIESYQSGFACGDKGVEDGFKHLRMNNINVDGQLDLSLVRTVPPELATERYRLQPDDVLVCTTNSGKLVGKSAMFNIDGDFAFSNHLTRLRMQRDIADPVYVQKQLWFKWVHGEIEPLCKHWVNQSTLPKEELLDLELSLPEVEVQRQIAKKLDYISARLDDTRARLETIPAILKRFRMSVLAAACSGRLTEKWRSQNPITNSVSDQIGDLLRQSQAKLRRGVPGSVPMPEYVTAWELPEAWACFSAADLLRSGILVDLKDGNHGANHPKVSEFVAEGIPFITAAQVSNFEIDYVGAYKLSGDPLRRIRVGHARKGDVIYTHKGSVGRVAIAERECILTPQTTYYRTLPEFLDARFLMYFLASPYFTAQVDSVKEQTTRDFVPISEQYLLFHRIPPLAEQWEIVKRTDALFAQSNVIESRYVTAKSFTDKLMPSVLAKAFRGELA